MSRCLLFALLHLFSVGVFSQITVSGTVQDERGEGLIGVTLAVGGTSEGTVTDAEGRFRLPLGNERGGPYAVYLSYLGFVSDTLRVRRDTTVSVTLRAATDVIPELIGGGLPLYAISTRRSFSQAHPNSAKLDNLRSLPTAQVSLPATLNYIPGVFVQTGALNTNRITIRGIGSRTPFGTDKVKAYLDDIPLTDGSGSSSLEDIDYGALEGIRVFRGPTASIFGAGLGGVIRLRTPDAVGGTTIGDYLSARRIPLGAHPLVAAAPYTSVIRQRDPLLTLQYGSFDSYLVRTGLTTLRGNWQHTFRAHYNDQDGYRANNRVRRYGALYRASVQLGEKHALSLLLNHTDFLGFIPSALTRTDYTEDPSRAAANWLDVAGNEDYSRTLAGLTWLARYGAWEQKLTLFGSRRYNDEVRPFNVLQEHSLLGGARGLWGRPAFGQNRRWSVLAGFEALRERLDWQTEANATRALLSEQREIRQYANVFAQAEYRVARWSVWAGLNYNQTDYRLTDEFLEDGEDRSGRFDFDGVVSPYLHLSRAGMRAGKWRFTPFAIVSHGFSPPSLEETLTPDGVYNPDIRPETGWNYEVGTQFAAGTGLAGTVSLYRMDIRNLLVARRTGLDQFIGVNAGRSLHEGIELAATYGWNPASRHHFLLSGQYSFRPYRFAEFVDGDADFGGNRLTGSPRQTAQLRLAHTWELRGEWQLETQLDQRYVGTQPITDDNSLFADAYAVSNLRVAIRTLSLTGLETRFFAGANNLLDARYAAMLNINARAFGGGEPRYFYPGLPRHFYVGVRLLR